MAHLPHHHPSRLIGNLAAVVLLALGAAYLFDRMAGWFGWKLQALCAVVSFVTPLTFTAGLILCAVGAVIWAASAFRNGAGAGLILGGTVLALLPSVMPHYFQVACIPSP